MKKILLMMALLPVAGMLRAQTLPEVKLLEPNLKRGKNIMQALSERQSTRKFAAAELTIADLSDLLWAATGINRAESGKRTNPTAMNKQEIEVYVCMAAGNYRYDPKGHRLVPIGTGDVRPLPAAPVNLVIAGPADFRFTDVDAGIVSQNISLFCAGVGLATVPRAGMDHDALKAALKLPEGMKFVLNHPVGYFVK